jgi:dihydrolipoamide dehydrogenase
VKIKTKNGKIVVDDFFMTSMPRVYAIGDVIEGVQLAHVASAQATFVVERMNEKEPSVILSVVPSCLFVSMSIIPSCLYMDPEIASVGLSEAAAKAKGVPIRCGECVMTDNGKSIINHDEEGFIKVVFAADSDVLLGAQIMCPRATDMIGELATAIANGLTSRQLMYAMRAHPTYNEAISTAVEASRRAVKK